MSRQQQRGAGGGAGGGQTVNAAVSQLFALGTGHSRDEIAGILKEEGGNLNNAANRLLEGERREGGGTNGARGAIFLFLSHLAER